MSDSRVTIPSIFAIIAIALLTLHDTASANGKKTVGWIEKAQLVEYGITIHAKIDSGARHSSLNAADILIFQKNDSSWIQFSVQKPNGKNTIIEAPVVRTAKVKRKGDKTQQRPVIMMKICLADVMKEVEVNLVDRSNFNYQMLVGRSFLQDNFLIDVSEKYRSEPRCR